VLIDLCGPAGFVSSISKDGCVNLSPYSYFNVMGHNPCIVALGICRSPGRGGGKKDSLQNIEETK
jgi:flavin reductase (DIM6/NTAB) family NADH-FMN oxidoreductase RutF